MAAVGHLTVFSSCPCNLQLSSEATAGPQCPQSGRHIQSTFDLISSHWRRRANPQSKTSRPNTFCGHSQRCQSSNVKQSSSRSSINVAMLDKQMSLHVDPFEHSAVGNSSRIKAAVPDTMTKLHDPQKSHRPLSRGFGPVQKSEILSRQHNNSMHTLKQRNQSPPATGPNLYTIQEELRHQIMQIIKAYCVVLNC